LGDHIVVRQIESESRTPGGLYLPDGAKEKPLIGFVLAVGPGKRVEGQGEWAGEWKDGHWVATRLEPDIRVDDMVLFTKYGGHQWRREDGVELMVLREEDILCVIEPSKSDALDVKVAS